MKLLSIILFLMSIIVNVTGGPAKILLDDPIYYSRYAGDTESAARYFKAQGFRAMTAAEILKFMREGDVAGSVILSLSDITPSSLAIPYDQSSALYQYCKNGGRYVSPAGSTLVFFIGEEDITETRFGYTNKKQGSYVFDVFGLKTVYGLRGKDRVLTADGEKWGLQADFKQWTPYLDLAIPVQEITSLVTTKNGEAALIWQKNLNENYPYSGLVASCFQLKNNLPMLETIYRLCLFNGEKVEVPKVNYAPQPKPEPPVVLTTRVGDIPRSVFERGEKIPVQVKFNIPSKPYTLQVFDKNRTQVAETNGAFIDTSKFGEGEYLLKCLTAEKKFHVVSPRKLNPFPFMVWKSSRPHLVRETYAAKFIAAQLMNQNVDDIHQMTAGNAERLGNVIDNALLNHQLFSVRTSAIGHFTENPAEKLVLYDGKVHSHGVNHDAFSSRAVVADIAKFMDKISAQVARVDAANAPNFYPFIIVNDDGSMLGNFDFNPLTMEDFTKKTGLKRADLPPFEKLKIGNNVYLPQVEPGIVPWEHPFLQYFRYHCGNYNQIAAANVKATGDKLTGDIGLMSGPLYVGRGFYPPLSHSNYNTICFYNYTFWYSAMTFNIEIARSAGRAKPLGVLASAAYIPWGEVYQRGILYRILAEAPDFVGLYHLDDSKAHSLKAQVDSTWRGSREVAANIAGAAELFKMQKVSKRQGAVFVGLAQLCFQIDHKNAYLYHFYSALENFRRAGSALDVITSEEVVAGKLKDYKAVFVSNHQWLTDKVKSELEKYIADGGKVVVDAATTVEIQGAEKADGNFGTGLNDIGTKPQVMLARKYTEKYLTPEKIMPVGIDTAVFANELPDGTPLVWVLDCESNAERKACQLEMNKDWNHGAYRYLTQLITDNPLKKHQLKLNGEFFVYDLFSHREINLELELPRMGAAALLLLKERIGKLTINTAKPSIRRGETATVNIQLKSSGTVPAQIKVELDGRELWEYGGNLIIRDGAAQFEIPAAVNALPGQWKITVTELASNQASHCQLEVL